MVEIAQGGFTVIDILQQVFELVREFSRAGVPLVRIFGHALQANRVELPGNLWVEFAGTRGL